jgi:hypothetical protein
MSMIGKRKRCEPNDSIIAGKANFKKQAVGNKGRLSYNLFKKEKYLSMIQSEICYYCKEPMSNLCQSTNSINMNSLTKSTKNFECKMCFKLFHYSCFEEVLKPYEQENYQQETELCIFCFLM